MSYDRTVPNIVLLVGLLLGVSACGDSADSRPGSPPIVDAVELSTETPTPGSTTAARAVARDPGGGELDYAWQTSNGEWTVSGSGETVEVTAPSAYESTTTLLVDVSDSAGTSTSESVQLTTGQNRLPRIVRASASPNPTEPGDTVELTAEARDSKSDELTYAWTARDGWELASDEGASVELTAPDATGTSATIELTVSDGFGGEVHRTLLVRTVADRPPRLTSVIASPPQVEPGNRAELTASAVDPEGGELTYSWSAPDPWTIEGSGARVDVRAPDSNGEKTLVQVEIADERGQSVTGRVRVATTTNRGPIIHGLSASPRRVDRGGSIALSVDASDPNDDALQYTWSVSIPDWSIRPNGDEAALIAPDKPASTARADVQVTDDDGLEAKASTIVSTRANRPPQLIDVTASPPVIGLQGESTLRADANDADGDALSYSWSAPKDWSISGNGAEVKVDGPDSYGQRASIRVTVDDAFGATSSGAVTVATGRNRPPVVSSITAAPPTVGKRGTSTLRATASDPNGDSLTYNWSIPKDWPKTGGSDAKITVRGPNRLGATGRFTLTVSDGNGGTGTGSVVLQTRRNRPPLITSLSASPNPVAPKKTTKVTARTADPEGDSLNYTWTLPGGWRGSSKSSSIDVKAPSKLGASGTLTLQVDDGRSNTSKSLKLETLNNRLPKVSGVSLSPNPVLQNGDATASVKASDPDGDSLTYQWSAKSGKWSVNGSGSSATVTAPNKGGVSTTLTVAVSDGKAGTTKGTLTATAKACPTTKGNCDGKVGNGCEVNLQADDDNCGTCGASCSGNEVCIQGKCQKPSCRNGANVRSRAPGGDAIVCDHPSNAVCEENFEKLCPKSWHLCTREQLVNRNSGWNYSPNEKVLGERYCRSGSNSGHYTIDQNLSAPDPFNCHYGTSRPSCTTGFGCNEKYTYALCCAPTPSCGDGKVNSPEEECDDGNNKNGDRCLNSCSWRLPNNHGKHC